MAECGAHPTAGWQAVPRGSLRVTRVRGVPLAGEALGFDDLFPRHPPREFVALLDIEPPCEVVGRAGPGQIEPHECQHLVLVDSGAVREHVAESPLSWRVPLLSRPSVPCCSLSIVTAHAAAPEIQKAQVVLRWRVALPGRKSDPSGCLDIVLRDPPPA